MSDGGRRGRWLLAGGIVGGLVLTPGARRTGMALRARMTRLARPAGDPVAPFLEAPCCAPDAVSADGAARTGAAR